MVNQSSSLLSSSSSTSSSHTQTSLCCMASLILMPNSDTDSVVEPMEGSGMIDLTAIPTTPKKGKRRRRTKLIREGRVSPTLVQKRHQITVNPVHALKRHPFNRFFFKEPDNDIARSTDQVVVAVPVLRQTSYPKKKRFVWSFSIDPDLPNFLVDDNNYQDELLIRCIIQESPWRAKHGARKTSWETTMFLLADQQHQLENIFEGASLITI